MQVKKKIEGERLKWPPPLHTHIFLLYFKGQSLFNTVYVKSEHRKIRNTHRYTVTVQQELVTCNRLTIPHMKIPVQSSRTI